MTVRVELTGYLGCDPRIRLTAEKTFLLAPRQRPQDQHLFYYGPHRPVPDPEAELPIESDAEIEITRPPRQFVALSVATNHGGQPVWHQLRAFNVDPDHPQSHYHDLYAVRMARKGDRVHVTGRVRSWRIPDPKDPKDDLFWYVDVESFQILGLKRRRYPD